MTVIPELHPVLDQVTRRVIARSATTRSAYLQRIRAARPPAMAGPGRESLGCANLAHGAAACGPDKLTLTATPARNLAIVTAYNDMLSAHQPFEGYPELIRAAAREAGGVAQVAGGVPAMCDGITQGRAGMELSLFSRDVIAMSTAVALSHDMFDAAVLLGVCDKIVPGLVMGALSFGHLPVLLAPAGPMPSGLPNKEKARIRQAYAAGEVGRDELLEAESRSYHGPGTCTFFGTANSNQLLMEIMGLHLPGSSFVNPGTPLRAALTAETARRALAAADDPDRAMGEIIDERAVLNGIVALLATGGSTNHTMHLVAMAGAAGVRITWDDFSDLSAVVPLLARIYPNGQADVNHFQAAGGVSLLVRELLQAGLLHDEVRTVDGPGLHRYTREPFLDGPELVWREGPTESLDKSVLRGVGDPFSPDGGLRVLHGNLGRSVVKTSAVEPDHRFVEAPAVVFDHQDELLDAYRAGELDARDFVAVVRYQGPRANGMPELHKLTPALGVLQDRGQRVAVVTDGRMSGASGKVPAALHVTPEAARGGPLEKVRDGDPIRLDTLNGTLSLLVDADEFDAREPARRTIPSGPTFGTGRELFGVFRAAVGPADEGAVIAGPGS
ncbi:MULTISPECIES: phosphogluconate dehydratase [Pseudonocardia]|uniref:Phosphogluconate dehydratase n=2 Tax=Pseudonocardia TaxID=1847 RepID=A0A1Y2N8D3_PSEAH|nr:MULTISPECIES: phosphogluconate dehydratase [Pseudonocardia]OSY43188.1 Phosphogluconate dehydratase [Pseudonocardia autotrophica]TDN71676.1 6-phosphogluconate dehydratase [Pseudonocardia autotrophica]BBG02363.1 phosphogluconate dehydratase [Pseudonocardia autotrophica]GEC23301.1 phosphogluconate dehydratase [Pseudonocardia saturnea]